MEMPRTPIMSQTLNSSVNAVVDNHNTAADVRSVPETIRPLRSSVNAAETHLNATVDFFDGKDLERLLAHCAGAGFEAELMTVHRANHLATSEHSFGERAESMRAAIPRSEYLSVALSEYGESLTINDVAASLAQRDGADTSQIHDGCESFFSHYFLQPPMRKLIRVH
jgi:hypothetical protein